MDTYKDAGVKWTQIMRTLLASIMMLAPLTGWAEAGVKLARDSQCLSCHQVERKRVGPAFAVIASRYAGTPGAQEYLATVIRQGSKSKWGAIPMPAQQHVSPEGAIKLAEWILSLADHHHIKQPETNFHD